MQGFEIKAVLWFMGSRETLLARVLKRAKTSGRVDDTEDIFGKRYQGFLDESKDIIHFSKQKNMLFQVAIKHQSVLKTAVANFVLF